MDAEEKVRALIEKWRKLEESYHDNADEWDNNYADGMGDATKACADELEAALVAAKETRS